MSNFYKEYIKYGVIVYEYETGRRYTIFEGSKQLCDEFIVEYLLSYLHRRNPVYNKLDDYCKYNETINKKEWNNTQRYFVNKDSSTEMTVKRMDKKVGWIYNSYPITNCIKISLVCIGKTKEKHLSRSDLGLLPPYLDYIQRQKKRNKPILSSCEWHELNRIKKESSMQCFNGVMDELIDIFGCE